MQRSSDRFEDAARQTSGGNLFIDYLLFLRQNKKWWVLPILTIMMLLGALMLLSGTSAAPFIYTLF